MMSEIEREERRQLSLTRWRVHDRRWREQEARDALGFKPLAEVRAKLSDELGYALDEPKEWPDNVIQFVGNKGLRNE